MTVLYCICVGRVLETWLTWTEEVRDLLSIYNTLVKKMGPKHDFLLTRNFVYLRSTSVLSVQFVCSKH